MIDNEDIEVVGLKHHQSGFAVVGHLDVITSAFQGPLSQASLAHIVFHDEDANRHIR